MNKLTNYIIIALLTLAAGAQAAPRKGEIIRAEKNVYRLLQDKKFDAFAQLLAPDFRGVYPDEIIDAGKQAAEVRTLDFQSVKLSHMEVVFIDNDAALISYHVALKATQNGKDISGNLIAASIWKKMNGTWRAAFHTDMTAK